MDEKEIAAKATELEKAAERGNEHYLANELHDMSPQERLAVAKQIMWDQQQHPSPSLPRLEFFDDGDLKSALKTETNGDQRKELYDDNTGKLTAVRRYSTDGTEEYTDFDENTKYAFGDILTYDRKNPDGSTEHRRFDPKTNSADLITIKDKRGNVETAIYDTTNHRLVATDTKFNDGSTLHLVFDANKQIIEVATKDKDGNINNWKRGDNNGVKVTEKQLPEPFRGIDSTEILFKDGMKVHLGYNVDGGLTNYWTRDYNKRKDIDLNWFNRR